MSTQVQIEFATDYTFNLGHAVSDEEFLKYCALNPHVRLELTSTGELVIMPPAMTDMGEQNSELNFQVKLWAKQDGRGIVYDSSTGFRIPNGAVRSPDTSWVLKSRMDALSEGDRKTFARLAPDAAFELRSPSDTVRSLQLKMEE